MTTLSQLKQRIDQLIENQGEESPVAAFIYTKEDFAIEDDKIIEDVLFNVEDHDWVYTQIQDIIENELKEVV